MSGELSKKKHKYIDSEEDELEQQQQTKEKEKSPEKQIIKIDQNSWNYLFAPDSSEQLEERKKKDSQKQQGSKQKQPDLKKKQNNSITDIDDIRYEILSRWWYCFDQWPPSDFNYDDALKKYKLRQVDMAVFKRESELNDDGFRKVYEVNGYKGVFRTSAGDTLDLRPKEGCPSYEQIFKINQKTLPKILLKGLKAQLDDLNKYEPNNKILRKQLERQIDEAQNNYKKLID